MSVIDPQRQAIVKELWSRKDSLDPRRKAVVEELGKRLGLGDPERKRPAGNTTASTSEFEKNLPAFSNRPWETPLKSVLDAPLDVAIGIEQGLGLDPMHPVRSVPGAAVGMAKGVGRLIRSGLTGKAKEVEESVLAGPAEAVRSGGAAIRRGDLPAAMQAVGRGYTTTKPAVEGVSALFKPESMLATTASEISDLSFVIKPGVKAAPLQPAARAVQPLLKQAAQEAGFGQTLNLTAQRFGRTPKPGDVFGDLYRGGSDAQVELIAKKLGQEYNPADPTPIPLMIADHAVDIAQRPLNAFINHLADEDATAIRDAVVADLERKAQGTIDNALKSNYQNLAEHARKAKPTVQGVNELKVYANKESAKLYKLYPGQEIQASVTPIQAFKDLADSVRQNLYPKLQTMGAPNLFEFGRQEAAAIAARDGIYQTWTKAAVDQVLADRQSYLNWVTEGHSDTFRFAVSERSAATVAATGRALKGRPNSLRDFNQAFRNGVGSVTGFKPADILLTKNPKLIGPNRPSSMMGSEMKISTARPTEVSPFPPVKVQGSQAFLEQPKAAKGQMSLLTTEHGGGAKAPPDLFALKQTPYRWKPSERTTYTMQDLQEMSREIDDYLKQSNPSYETKRELMRDLIQIRQEIFRRQQARK